MTRQEKKRNEKETKLAESYAIYKGRVVTCFELQDNLFTSKTLVGFNPEKQGKNIFFKDTAYIDYCDIFDNEEDARFSLLERRETETRISLTDQITYLRATVEEKDKKLWSVIKYLFALDILLFISFCILASGV